MTASMKSVLLTALLLMLLGSAIAVYQKSAPVAPLPQLSESEKLAQMIDQYEASVSKLNGQMRAVK